MHSVDGGETIIKHRQTTHKQPEAYNETWRSLNGLLARPLQQVWIDRSYLSGDSSGSLAPQKTFKHKQAAQPVTWRAESKQQDLEKQINAGDISKKSQATLSGQFFFILPIFLKGPLHKTVNLVPNLSKTEACRL